MSRPVVVLRPQPGNAATVERLAALGLHAIPLPLFQVSALDWQTPAPDDFDALLLTSANAVRHAGPALADYRALPVLAVGEATAAAARAAGLDVMAAGNGNAAALVELAKGAGIARALHLGGRHSMIAAARDGERDTIVRQHVAVYDSVPVAIDPARLAAIDGGIAMLHSARAARRLATLVATDGATGDLTRLRARIGIAAISPAVLAAAGDGWRVGLAADQPRDDALVALARHLAD